MPSRQNTTGTLGSYSTQADYQLPRTIDALRDGWATTFQTSAIMASLFAIIESVLLVFVKTSSQFDVAPNAPIRQALIIFTYLAFFLSLSAAISSLLLTDEMGSMALRASRGVAAGRVSLSLDLYDEGTLRLLSRFNGGRRSWCFVMWHWMFTLATAYLCLLVQLVLYAWCTEETGLKIAILCIAVITSFPLVGLVPRLPYCGSGTGQGKS